MRSEEEKTEDILFYEKKAGARELLQAFYKKKRKARLTALAAFAVLAAALSKTVISAYDSENVALVAVAASAVVLAAAAAYFTVGAVLCRSPAVFFRWQRLSSRWKSAEETMSKIEEKFSDRTVYEPDVDKAEMALLLLAEQICALGENSKK